MESFLWYLLFYCVSRWLTHLSLLRLIHTAREQLKGPRYGNTNGKPGSRIIDLHNKARADIRDYCMAMILLTIPGCFELILLLGITAAYCLLGLLATLLLALPIIGLTWLAIAIGQILLAFLEEKA